jgi:hypothetical protein
MKTVGIVLVIAGIVGLLIGGGIFLFMTKTVPINTMPITIEKASYYTGQTSGGFLNPKTAYYSQLQVVPTPMAKANVSYLITTDNGIIKQNYSISWSQLELGISKSKTITDKISQDELTALKQNSQYTVKVDEIKPQHKIIYVIPGILFFILGGCMYLLSPSPSSKGRKKRGYVPPTPQGYPHYEPNSPRGADWIAAEHGPAYRPENKNENEHVEFVEPVEIIKPQSVSDEGKDPFSKYKLYNSTRDGLSEMQNKMKSDENDSRKSILKQEVSDLAGEGKITINEAVKLNQQIEDTVKNPQSYVQTRRFLHSIWNRPIK